MRHWQRLVMVLMLLALAGCTALVVPPVPPQQLWQDEAFHYDAARVVETRESLFTLDAAQLAHWESVVRHTPDTERRLHLLLNALYGPQGINLSYQSGHTTSAAQTWQNRRGDCLSLTLFTYAVTQALGIEAHMQEVRVPIVIDRRGGVDFQNDHVNLYVPTTSFVRINGRDMGWDGVVIDFVPQPGSRQHGTPLSRDAIAARFYNNRATEFLVEHDLDQAYAYYKQALLVDPGFAAAYSNLAQLYAQQGLATAAETLLRHAVALNPRSDAALHALLNLLRAAGNEAQASAIAAELHRRQDQDPYYWLGLGLDHLRYERYGQAIAALERADGLASGFAELHRYLALAYWRNGQTKEAGAQLAQLMQLDRLDPGIAVLQKKLAGQPAPQ